MLDPNPNPSPSPNPNPNPSPSPSPSPNPSPNPNPNQVLRIRKRYLQLHRLGRYRVKGQRRLSDREVGELLDVEELLELDTILLFRRFVGWQMEQLLGAAVAREAFVGSEIEDLLRADYLDGAGTGAPQNAEAGGTDTACQRGVATPARTRTRGIPAPC